MDNDSEVNAPLDIPEFCTQKNDEKRYKFYFSNITNMRLTMKLKFGEYLKQWCKINNFETRMFRTFPMYPKYGDAIFLRDPRNKKIILDPKLTRIIVNESKAKDLNNILLKK